MIDDKTITFFGSGGGGDPSVGGFTWSGHFTWESLPEQVATSRQPHLSSLPVLSFCWRVCVFLEMSDYTVTYQGYSILKNVDEKNARFGSLKLIQIHYFSLPFWENC
jgi:hypothetical protein